MAKIDDQTKQLQSDLAATQADIQTISAGVGQLQTQAAANAAAIAALQQQLADAGLSSDQQAALDATVASADALKSTADSLATQFPPPAPAPQAQIKS